MRKGKASRLVTRVALCVLTLVLLVVIGLYGVMWILVNGPSEQARRLFVISVDETSAGGFLARLYLSEAEITEIKSSVGGTISDDKTDASLIKLPSDTAESPDTTDAPSQAPTVPDSSSLPSDTSEAVTTAPSNGEGTVSDGIEVLEVKGATYNGKLLIIKDPRRVFVGIPDRYGEDAHGLTVAAMIDKYDAVAGTNAGGFVDPNGQGTGGIPDGIIIYEGELKWGSENASYSLAGIDGNGILHVGSMTGGEALARGIRYAASYGPALVINGQPASSRLGGGLNPRTAIGQRADGAILLLVVNGRSVESLGATLDDLASIMLDHGAVNASNLDGGSSSLMIMNGEYLTSSAYIFGERVVASAILVRK